MNEEMMKSLVDLIDETLVELDELRKSDRFSASEVKIEGPGDGIAGKPSDGSLGKEEDKKKDEDDKDDEDKKKDEAKKAEEAKKADVAKGVNDEAEKAEKSATPETSLEKKEEEVSKGKNEEAEKAESDESDESDEDDKDESSEEDKKMSKKKMKKMLKKSEEELSSLMKSYLDDKIKPIQDTVNKLAEIVTKLSDQPVEPKGFTAKMVPLEKSSASAAESLSKSEIANKLFELKKSGKQVDTLDIAKVEMGQDLHQISEKYKIG